MPDATLTPDKRELARTHEFTPNPVAPFVELGVTTAYSFLEGASEAVDLIELAHAQGHHALGVADRNTLAGVVRVHTNALTAKLTPLIGARLELVEGYRFLAYPIDRAAYGRLSTLLSRGKMRTPDGRWQTNTMCEITLPMLIEHAAGVQLILLPPDDLDAPTFRDDGLSNVVALDGRTLATEGLMSFAQVLPRLVAALPTLKHVAAAYLYRGDDVGRINRLDQLARANGSTILATNDVLYAHPSRRPLQDIITCIHHGTTLADAGRLLEKNGERHLKTPDEMVELFARWPHAIAATRVVADRTRFSLQELGYRYPKEIYPDDRTAQEHLIALTHEGAARAWPGGVPDPTAAQIEHELSLIGRMDLAQYFLTIHDIVAYARSQGILCQGRGSAANSTVCFCLGITSVDPSNHELLFERFISEERNEPPDIDVDFEHERREEVIQHIYAKYGRHRAALAATVIHYRPRSAIREVGKVMGLTEDVTAALARTVWGSWGTELAGKAEEAGVDLTDPHLMRAVKLAEELIGMPRHLSQHVGGFVLTDGPLIETVPIGTGAMPDRTFIEWDKDDIDALKIMKVDILALGMLTCARKGLRLLKAHLGIDHSLASIPQEGEESDAVYKMLQRGDSLGTFQVESRAQMNMLPRLKPACFYDLVIQVAIVRPGPIQGDMVHPFLRRRQKREEEVYPSPGPEHDPDELKNILKRTLGVPIFQEQAMKIAMVAARFSPAEANQLRKAMATFRSGKQLSAHKETMVGRMVERGYDPEFAARCFSQIEGFGEYGFPESHAASFAHLVYVSSWLKCHHPAIFCAALLNSQPMGFYAPAQIVRDAREHGVTVLAADVNLSDWDTTCEWQVMDGERQLIVRLGLRHIEGLATKDGAALIDHRRTPYAAVEELAARAHLHARPIGLLAAADAMRSMGLDRRQALWEARAVKPTPALPLFAHAAERDEGREDVVPLPAMPLSEHVVADYQTTRLSLKAHPMQFLRSSYERQGYVPASSLRAHRFGQRVRLSGVVLIRQRPGSAKGVCFITLEDETGVANLVIWPDVMERFRAIIMGARLMEVDGFVQMDDDVTHIVVRGLRDGTARLSDLSDTLLNAPVARADHVKSPLPHSVQHTHPRNAKVLPDARNFH